MSALDAATFFVSALLLIRSRDFVRRDGAEGSGVSPATAQAGADGTSPARSA